MVEQDSDENSKQPEQDAGTVVGEIKTATDQDVIDTDLLRTHDSNGISPMVKALARKLEWILDSSTRANESRKKIFARRPHRLPGMITKRLIAAL